MIQQGEKNIFTPEEKALTIEWVQSRISALVKAGNSIEVARTYGARHFASLAHNRQKLKSDPRKDYITHTSYVAGKQTTELRKQLGHTHDISENTNFMPGEVAEALAGNLRDKKERRSYYEQYRFKQELITRPEMEINGRTVKMPYLDYTVILGTDADDSAVKEVDLETNLDPHRAIIDETPISEAKLLRRQARVIAYPYMQAINRGRIARGTLMSHFVCGNYGFLDGRTPEDLYILGQSLERNCSDVLAREHFNWAVRQNRLPQPRRPCMAGRDLDSEFELESSISERPSLSA